LLRKLAIQLLDRRYRRGQQALVGNAIDDWTFQRAFAEDAPLPPGYGFGFDERVVELPWVFSRLQGRTLDAGSSLNHPHILKRVLPRLTSLHIVTAAPEERAYPQLGVSYVFADIRELPLRSDYYDTVCCISTLEHVGMDNSDYGGPPREPDPGAAASAAVAELKRVLAGGGKLLVTVPFGVSEDHDWLRQYGEAELDELAHELGGQVEVTIFQYSGGWRRSTPAAAAGARYVPRGSTRASAPDRAVAARAVACLEAAPGA
jgi:SAM-dependent methyltransferase